MHEIDDSRRADELLAGERRLLEMVAMGAELADVLDALCRVVEQHDRESMCSVLLVDASRVRLTHGAAPTLPASYVALLEGRALVPEWGPCALAVGERMQVVIPNLAVDVRWRDTEWLAAVASFGIESAWTTPIVARNERVLGTFAIYRRVAGMPSSVQRELTARFTHIASIAIERAQHETALEKVRSELAHVSRVTTLGELTASIAHEVNQPLAGIVTNASTCLRMLAGDPPNLEGARETARRAIRDANRASDVVGRLRLMFGKKTAASEPVDLTEATRDVLLLMRNELEKSRVVLRTELDDRLPAVKGDRVQLQQVVLNLVLNAAEAMSAIGDRPRELLVCTDLDGDSVRVAVRDAGSGIDPADVDRIFDAFFTSKPAGMGMGLSVSRSIVDRHHGRIWAAPNDDHGTTFFVAIPRDGSEAERES